MATAVTFGRRLLIAMMVPASRRGLATVPEGTSQGAWSLFIRRRTAGPLAKERP
jgi:hypothetical protein